MALHQPKKQSDLEKRLRLLRQQIYGRSPEKTVSEQVTIPDKFTRTLSDASTTINHRESVIALQDITYLYKDLSKIGVFATIAIAAQIMLFILTKNHIINLNFF